MRHIIAIALLVCFTATQVTAQTAEIDALLAEAVAGDARAQFSLGVMYAEGAGVPENDAEAVKWFRLAAEQGFADAQFKLGFMHAYGDGVAENDVEAVQWYRLAAEQGFAMAQLALGVMYAIGEGVAENYAKAYLWFSMAAAQGEEGASELRDDMSGLLTAEARNTAQQLASRCFDSGFKDCD